MTPRFPWPAGSGPNTGGDVQQKLVFPGVDTCFMGVNEERGPLLRALPGLRSLHPGGHRRHLPHHRCSKRMLNGPCGGSDKGKCEINPDVPCGWG